MRLFNIRGLLLPEKVRVHAHRASMRNGVRLVGAAGSKLVGFGSWFNPSVLNRIPRKGPHQAPCERCILLSFPIEHNFTFGQLVPKKLAVSLRYLSYSSEGNVKVSLHMYLEFRQSFPHNVRNIRRIQRRIRCPGKSRCARYLLDSVAPSALISRLRIQWKKGISTSTMKVCQPVVKSDTC